MEQIKKFEQALQSELTQMCRDKKLIGERLPETPDIDDAWESIATEYIPDALREVTEYPLVALGWAMYAGIGTAVLWDTNWQKYSALPNIYTYMRDKRGFDYMDEYVREEMMHIHDEEFKKMEQTIQSFALHAQSRLQHEGAEPQSTTAFHLFVAATRALYRTGAGIMLKRLKYDMEEM